MQVRYFDVPDALKDLFRSFLLMEVDVPEGEAIADLMLPLWGNLTWRDRANVEIGYRSGEIVNAGRCGVIGPHDRAVQAIVGPVRQWTAVLMPGAWARCIDAPARSYLNRTVAFDGMATRQSFEGLCDTLFSATRDDDKEYARLMDFLLPLSEIPRKPIERRVGKVLEALATAKISKVGDMADHLGITRRTLERICDEIFGLSPKSLLRRQRFVRSVAVHMLNGQSSWSYAIDESYHDQAHFVREFRQIMGVTPSEHARMKRPLTVPFLLENLRKWQEAQWSRR